MKSAPASLETEIKLRLRPGEPIHHALRQLGFRVAVPRRFEDNFIFDFEDGRLTRAGLLLRLRRENGRCLLTLKGPPRPARRYKVRPEMEVEMSEETARRLRLMLRAAGLHEIFRYQKFRTTYAAASRRGGCSERIFWDETPIGDYVEIEGTRRGIDRIARRLRRKPADYITASYGKLYLEVCQRPGVRPGNMVFSRARRVKRKS